MNLVTRRTAVVLATLVTGLSATTGAGAAGTGVASRVVNRETVQAELHPDGDVKIARLFSQLLVEGDGTVHVVDPSATKNLRDLDGFSKPNVVDGNAVWDVDVSGRAVRRTVAEYDKPLPVDVDVTYELDGERVSAGEVVGRSGLLKVTYKVRNMTGVPTAVTYKDGKGVTHTETVDVPTPLVGQLQTTLPKGFSDIDAPRADIAGDGHGGSLMTWTMVLFSPIGETTQEFGWSARIGDGEVPKATVQVVPVPPKRKPELKFGEDGLEHGAHAASELTAGAGLIDTNVLKLRDGASELLAGLGRLAAGATKLQAGLAGSAAPGSRTLADGLGSAKAGGVKLATGLSEINAGADRVREGLGVAEDGSLQLLEGSQDLAAGAGLTANGAGQVASGASALASGAGTVATGAGALSGGLTLAAAGAADLSAGLQQISAGLAVLAGVNGLPAAKAGAIALQQGVAAILAGVGSAATPGTILNGLAQVGGGLGTLATGLPAAKGGVDLVNAGLATAKSSLAALQLAVGGSVAEINGALATLGCPGSLNPVCPLLDSALNSSHGLATVTLPGLAAVEAGAGDGIAGLTAVSSGLGTAIAGVTALSTGVAQVTAGVEAVKLGLDNPGGLGVKQGLDQLVAGLTAAVTGVTTLNAGAAVASSGADALASGTATLAAGSSTLAAGTVALADGANDLAGGAGHVAGGATRVADGAGQVAKGQLDLSDGLSQLFAGSGRLAAGTSEAAGGAGDLADGLGKLADGSVTLADGLGEAADGAGQIADGLGQAQGGGQRLTDGAGQLSKEGTSKLVVAGNETAAESALSFARLQALDERAATGSLPYGAPAGGEGSAAYLLTIAAANAQGTEDAGRGLLALGILAAGSAVGAVLRRRAVA